MLKRLLIATALIFPLAFTACNPDNANPQLGHEFYLSIGQSATIQSENLTLTFNDVLADSRCATGVQCFWAGEAKSSITFNLKGKSQEVVLTEPGLTQPPSAVVEGYRISFQLNPYPKKGVQIEKSDYKLVLSLSK
jgi:hypothetical protein